MGAQISQLLQKVSKNPELLAQYAGSLNKEDVQSLQNVFKEISGKGTGGGDGEDKLKKLTGGVLSEEVAHRLYGVMSDASHKPNSTKSGLNFKGFLSVVSDLTQGQLPDQAQIISRLASDNKEGPVPANNMMNFVSEAAGAYFTSAKDSPQMQSWSAGLGQPTGDSLQGLAFGLLKDLFFKDKPAPAVTAASGGATDVQAQVPNQSFDIKAIQEWLTKSPIVLQIVQHVFKSLFAGGGGAAAAGGGGGALPPSKASTPASPSAPQPSASTVTTAAGDDLMPMAEDIDWSWFDSILTSPAVLFLNQNIPKSMRGQWRYLFSSRHFGDSWNQLIKKIVDQGPVIIVVQDKAGRVFGGFASGSLKVSSEFYGDSDTFLFTLSPAMAVYKNSGSSGNYIYLNQKQTTAPNGLGFGGQTDKFGLWIDSSYGKGACNPCSTFNSPQIASEAEFKIDTLEVWAAGPKPEPQLPFMEE